MTMTAPPTTPPIQPPAPRAGARLLRTRKRWIAGTTLLVVLGAAAFSFLATPSYEATADVVVLPLVSANGPTPQTPSMGTEQSLVLSDLVAGGAARRLGLALPDLLRAASVTVPAQTETLAITCATTDAAFSARCAQELAQGYVEYKDSQPIMTLPERGRIISPAAVPPSPTTPNLVLNLLAGLVVGLVLGVLVAVLRDRLDSRIRVAADLEQRGLRVLGVVPARGAGAGNGSGTEERSRAFGSLAAKVRGAVGAAPTDRAPVVVVTALGDEDTLESPAVASALASALAASGERVVLVNADLASPTGTTPRPGLLDLLAGRIDLADAVTTSSHPQLRTVSVGRRPPARIGGPEWSRTSRLLGGSADLVVVAADPMLLSANGLTVAQAADALVAVAVGRATTRSDVEAFVRESRELGLPLVGAALTVDTVRRPRRDTRREQAERDGWGSWADVLASDPSVEEPSSTPRERPARTETEEPWSGRRTGPRVVPTTVVSPRGPSVLESVPRAVAGTGAGNGAGNGNGTDKNGTGVHPVPPT